MIIIIIISYLFVSRVKETLSIVFASMYEVLINTLVLKK